jgi:cell pole-organizing protein PopZ
MNKKSKEILSKDTAIALKAEISKYSDTFDVSETQKLIEETVNIVTENLLKEWLNVNMDKIVKNAIKEELANLAKKKTSSKK